MKLKLLLSNILKNRWALNIVSFLSLVSIIWFLLTDNFNAIAYFIVLGLLVYYFSKNMIIVLGIPLIFVNLFSQASNIKEGLTTQTADSMPEVNTKPANTKPNKKAPPAKKTPQGLPQTTIDSDTSLASSIDSTDHAAVTTNESFEVGRAKQSGGYNIDYASTVEDAYSELNKILGGDGIKNLTNDTQKLMKQQLQLADAMKGMGPLIKNMAPLMQQAQGLLGGMNEKDGLGGIMELAKKFSGSAVEKQ